MDHLKIINSVKKSGFCKVESFLDKKDLEKVDKILKKRILNKNIKKDDSDTYFYRDKDKNFLLKKITKLNFSFFIDCLKLIKLSKELGLEKIANEILSSKSKLCLKCLLK